MDDPTPDQVQRFIAQGLDCEHLDVEGDGRHFFATIVSAEFAGMGRQTEVVIPRMSLSEGLERVMSHPERAPVFEAAWKLAKGSLEQQVQK